MINKTTNYITYFKSGRAVDQWKVITGDITGSIEGRKQTTQTEFMQCIVWTCPIGPYEVKDIDNGNTFSNEWNEWQAALKKGPIAMAPVVKQSSGTICILVSCISQCLWDAATATKPSTTRTMNVASGCIVS